MKHNLVVCVAQKDLIDLLGVMDPHESVLVTYAGGVEEAYFVTFPSISDATADSIQSMVGVDVRSCCVV